MRPLLKFGDKLTRENNEILALDREVDTAGAGALLSTQRYGTEHFFFFFATKVWPTLLSSERKGEV